MTHTFNPKVFDITVFQRQTCARVRSLLEANEKPTQPSQVDGYLDPPAREDGRMINLEGCGTIIDKVPHFPDGSGGAPVYHDAYLSKTKALIGHPGYGKVKVKIKQIKDLKLRSQRKLRVYKVKPLNSAERDEVWILSGYLVAAPSCQT